MKKYEDAKTKLNETLTIMNTKFNYIVEQERYVSLNTTEKQAKEVLVEAA